MHGLKMCLRPKAMITPASMFGALLAFVAPSPSWAGSAGLGNITAVTGQPSVSSTFFFNTNGTRVSAPSCATVAERWVIDVTTPSGQASAALIIAAQAQGKKVEVGGTGNCSVWGDTETVAYVNAPS